jgi:hypothetical protein
MSFSLFEAGSVDEEIEGPTVSRETWQVRVMGWPVAHLTGR